MRSWKRSANGARVSGRAVSKTGVESDRRKAPATRQPLSRVVVDGLTADPERLRERGHGLALSQALPQLGNTLVG
jgi:hypothetical protein